MLQNNLNYIFVISVKLLDDYTHNKNQNANALYSKNIIFNTS
jgi:hypothetical protein